MAERFIQLKAEAERGLGKGLLGILTTQLAAPNSPCRNPPWIIVHEPVHSNGGISFLPRKEQGTVARVLIQPTAKVN
jgi:hypothetical protein